MRWSCRFKQFMKLEIQNLVLFYGNSFINNIFLILILSIQKFLENPTHKPVPTAALAAIRKLKSSFLVSLSARLLFALLFYHLFLQCLIGVVYLEEWLPATESGCGCGGGCCCWCGCNVDAMSEVSWSSAELHRGSRLQQLMLPGLKSAVYDR